MKKVLVLFLLLILLIGCSHSDIQQNTDLEDAFYSVVVDKNNSELSLKSVTEFDWEKAFLFAPYSTKESIEEQLDIDFRDPSNINMRDDIYLLVFLNEDAIVQYAEVERQGADFSIGEKEHLTPSSDVISIERN